MLRIFTHVATFICFITLSQSPKGVKLLPWLIEPTADCSSGDGKSGGMASEMHGNYCCHLLAQRLQPEGRIPLRGAEMNRL